MTIAEAQRLYQVALERRRDGRLRELAGDQAVADARVELVAAWLEAKL